MCQSAPSLWIDRTAPAALSAPVASFTLATSSCHDRPPSSISVMQLILYSTSSTATLSQVCHIPTLWVWQTSRQAKDMLTWLSTLVLLLLLFFLEISASKSHMTMFLHWRQHWIAAKHTQILSSDTFQTVLIAARVENHFDCSLKTQMYF